MSFTQSQEYLTCSLASVDVKHLFLSFLLIAKELQNKYFTSQG